MKRIVSVLIPIMVLALALGAGAAFAAEQGVYIKAAANVKMPFDEAVRAVRSGLEQAGWEVLASYPSGVDDRCGRRAHTLVVHSAPYAEKILAHGPLGAFALPLRVGVYEDNEGIHVAFLNPVSINRTVLGDGVEEALGMATQAELAKTLSAAAKGAPSQGHLGQMRAKGHVGGMGGGAFAGKVETIHSGGDFASVLGKIKAGIASGTKGWRLVYSIEPAPGRVAILGVTNPATEARAYGIAGEKRETKENVCPGLDHSSAFPVEIVVYRSGDAATAALLDEMYRMKVYFEDAGNWAFMKNMAMPGAIEDEIREAATSGLK